MRGGKIRERAKLSTRELVGVVGVNPVHDRPGEWGETVPTDTIASAVAMAKLGFRV